MVSWGTENRPVFSPVEYLPPVKQIAAGIDHAVVLTMDNEVMACIPYNTHAT